MICPDITITPFKQMDEVHKTFPYWWELNKELYSTNNNSPLVSIAKGEYTFNDVTNEWDLINTVDINNFDINLAIIAKYEDGSIRNITYDYVSDLSDTMEGSLHKHLVTFLNEKSFTVNEAFTTFNTNGKYDKLIALINKDKEYADSKIVLNETNDYLRTVASLTPPSNVLTIYTRRTAFAMGLDFISIPSNRFKDIDFNTVINEIEDSVLHESTHKLLGNVISDYKAGTLTDEILIENIKKLEHIYNYVSTFTNDYIPKWQNEQAFESLEEFITNLIGDTSLQKYLSKIELPQALQVEGKVNVFEYIINLFESILGIKKSALYNAMIQIEKVIDYNQFNTSKTNIIKEGVSDVFDSNPELSKIGTPEQYSQYLDTIFPDSKVKDIVYHSRFNVDNITNKDRWRNGFYSGTKDQADLMADMAEDSNDLMITSALLINMQNPKITTYADRKVEDYKNSNDGFIIEATEKDALQLIGERDGYNVDNFKKEYVVFEPEQIHILGSKQDIEGFKTFVSNNIKNKNKQLTLDFQENSTMYNDYLTLAPEEVNGRKTLNLRERTDSLLTRFKGYIIFVETKDNSNRTVYKYIISNPTFRKSVSLNNEIEFKDAINNYKQLIEAEYITNLSVKEIKESVKSYIYIAGMQYIKSKDINGSVQYAIDLHKKRYNSLLSIQEKLKNNTELSTAELKLYNDNVKTNLDKIINIYKNLNANSNVFENYLKAEFKSLRFLDKMADSLEELDVEENTYEKTKFNENARFEVDLKTKMSSDIRLFLFSILETTIEGESVYNELGMRKTVDYNSTFKQLRSLFANQILNEKTLKELLSNSSNPIFKNILSKITELENSNDTNQKDYIERIKRELIEAFGLNNTNHLLILKKEGQNRNDYRVINSNQSDSLKLLNKVWENQFNLKLINQFKTVEDVQSFKNIILNNFINSNPADFLKTIQNNLALIGIEIPIDVLNKIYLDKGDKNFNFNRLLIPIIKDNKTNNTKNFIAKVNDNSYFEQTGSIFNSFFNTIIENIDNLENKNPYTIPNQFNIDMKVLGRKVVKNNPLNYADSFLSIDGKKVYPFQLYTAQQLNLLRLKSDKAQLLKLNNISITSNSLLLNDILLNPDSVEIYYIEGLKTENQRKGKSRKELTSSEQDIVALQLINQGYFIDITHSDRKLSPVMKWHKFNIGTIKGMNKTHITDISDDSRKFIERQYLAEANRIIKFTNTVKDLLAENDYTYDSYTKNADKFVMFDILNKNRINKYLTEDEISEIYPDGKLTITAESKELLWKVIKNVYIDEINQTIDKWYNDGTINITNRISELDYNYMNNQGINTNMEKAVANAAMDLVLNQSIFMAESIRVLAGDPAYNKSVTDYQKRASRNGATYKQHYYLKPFISKLTVNDRMIRSNYSEIYNDKTGTKNYEKINSTDGAEYGTVLEMLEVKFAHNQIPFSIYNSITDKYLKSITDGSHYFTLSEEEKKYIYQIDKPVMIGNYVDEANDTIRPIFRKSSILYLIPEITKGTPYDAIRIFMEKNKIDRLGHTSTDKYGAKKVLNVFNKKGEFIEPTTSIESFIDREIPREFLGIQQDIPTKSLHGINYISQLHKLIGESLTSPEFKELLNKKNEIVKSIFNIKKDNLYKEIGISVDNDMISFNTPVFHKWLTDLAKNNDWSDIELKSIELDENNEFKYPLSLNIFARQIEYNIMAYIKKSLVSHKIPGTSFIQSPNNNTKIVNLEEYEKLNKGLYFVDGYDKTKGLKHTLEKDGTIRRSQIIISWKFTDNDGNVLDINKFINSETNQIDLTKIPKELLESIMSRIPHQGHNSATVFEIVGFLPSYMGNMMIIPDELINQTGSDFDIDKIYTYIYKHVYYQDKLIIVNRENAKLFNKKAIMYRYNETSIAKKAMDEANNIRNSKELDTNNSIEQDYISAKNDKILISEFNELNYLLNDYIKVLNDIFYTDTVINKSIQPLDKDDLKLEYNKLKIEKPNTIVSWSYQRDSYSKQQAGKDLIAISSLLSIFNATIQGFQINLRKITKNGFEGTEVNIGGKELDRMTGTGVSYYNGEKRSIHDNITIAQSLFVDYAKDPIGFDLHLNDYVAPIAMFISMLSDKNNTSLAWDKIISFINQDIIKEYVDLKINRGLEKQAILDSLDGKSADELDELSKFIKVEDLYAELSTYMNLIMFASRKGGGKLLTDYINFEEVLSNIKETSFENIEKLLFETENGFYFSEIDKILNAINNKYFIYKTPVIKSIKETIESSLNRTLSMREFREVVDEYKIFLYSDFFKNILNDDKPIDEIRKDMLLSDNNISNQYYKLIDKYPSLKENTLLKKLDFEYKDNLSLIKFVFSEKDKSLLGENSQGLIDLIDMNNDEVTTFVQNLIAYSFLTGNVQTFDSLIDNIDSRLFENFGLASYLNQFNFNDVNEELISNFVTQYFQHYGYKAQKVQSLTNITNKTNFVNYKYNLYILNNQNKYDLINKLGNDYISEYSTFNNNVKSIFNNNNVSSKNTVINPIKVNVNNIAKSNATYQITIPNNAKEILNDIEKSETKQFAIVAKILNNINLPAINIQQRLSNVQARGIYDSKNIFINPTKFYRLDKKFEYEEVFLHEYEHHFLNHVLSTLKDQPKKIKDLVAQIEQLRIDAREHLKNKGFKEDIDNIDNSNDLQSLSSKSIKLYGLKNIHEFVSELMNNPDFQKSMNNIESKNISLFDKFINIINDLLVAIAKQIGINVNQNSILAEGVATITNLMKEYESLSNNVQSTPVKRNDVIGILKLRNNSLAYTNDQINALHEFEKFIDDKNNNVFILKGYAGTGKTTIIENMINYSQQLGYSVGVSSLLNKVVDKLENNFQNKTINSVEVKTLHSLLYYPKEDSNGNTIFAEKEGEFEDDLIIIDEASLLSKEIIEQITKIANRNNTKIVYVGDTAQLESIGTYYNILNSRDIYNPELSEVKRTDNTSNILKLATYIRDNKYPTITDAPLDNVKYYINGDAMVTDYINLLKTKFNDETAVYITATNKERIRLNNLIHKQIDSKLIDNNTPLMSLNNTMFHSNGEIFTMQDVEIINEQYIIINDTNYKVYTVVDNNDDEFFFIPDIEPSVVNKVKQNEAFKNKYKKDELKEIPIITYGYVVTGHKIQGLEFNHVFVDQNYNFNAYDIKVGDRIFDSKYKVMIVSEDNIKDIKERMKTEPFYITNNYKWLYTAITRSNKKVYIKRLSLYNQINNEELNEYFDTITRTTSNNPVIDTVDLNNLKPLDNPMFSPTVEGDISSLITQLENQVKILDDKINNVEDNTEKIFINEYRNLLEEEVFLLETQAYNVNNITNLNKKIVSFINTVLNKESNFAFELQAVLNLTDIFSWDNVLHYLPEEMLNDDTNLIKQEFKKLSSSMIEYNDKIINHTRSWVSNLINKNRNKELSEVMVEDLVNFTNIDMLKSEFLDLSHINNPLVQEIQKYLVNSSRNTESHIFNLSKAIETEWNKVKDMKEIKDNLLIKRNSHNELTNQLVTRYSDNWNIFLNQYNDVKREIFTVAKNSEDYMSMLTKGYNNILFKNKNNFVDNVEIIDVNFFINDNYSNAEYKSKDEYIAYLEKTYDKDFIQEVIGESKARYESYLTNRESFERFYQSQKVSVEEMDSIMEKWDNENNPLTLINALQTKDISSLNPLRIEQLMKNIKFIPKKANYYDSNYKELLKNEKLLNFYKFYVNNMNNFLDYLPSTSTTFMNKRTLPAIHKDFMKGMFNQSLTQFFSTIGSNVIDSITNKKVKSLLQESEIASNQRDINTGELLPTIPVYFTKKISPEGQSYELGHILELFGAMAINYKFKSEIEDYVKLMQRILDEASEIKKGANGKPMLDKNHKLLEIKNGNIRLKETVDYAIKATLYNQKRKDDLTDTGIVLYSLNPKSQIAKTKKAKELKNKLLDLDIQYENELIDTSEYNDMKKAIDAEYKALKGKSIDVSSTIDGLNHFTQLKGLGLSLTSGISNLSFGLFSNILHSYGKVDYTPSQYFKALGYTLSHIKTLKNNKMLNLLNKYNILFEVNEIEYGQTLTRQYTLLNKIDLMIFQRKTELINQSSSFLAMMVNKKVFVSELDKEIDLFEAYNDNGELKYESLKNDWNVSESGITENEFTKFRNKAIQVNKLVHGNYDPNSPVKIKATSIGRALMVFRSWMAEGFAQRWQGERYDDMLGRTVKGRYRTYADLGIKQSLPIMFKALLRNKESYKDLKPYEIENMRKNLAELVMLGVLVGMTALLKMAWDDDDEDRPGVTNVALNMLFRTEQDIWFYVSPTTFGTIIREPVPFMGTLTDFGKAIDKTQDYIFKDDYNIKYSPLYYWSKALPVTSSYLRMEYQTDYLLEQIVKSK